MAVANALPDVHCPLVGAQIVGAYTCILNQTQIDVNANKQYTMQVLQQGGGTYVWKRWGRIGVSGQHRLTGPMTPAHAAREFETTFLDKTGLSWSSRTDPPKDGCYMYARLDVANTSTGASGSGSVVMTARAPMPKTDPNLHDRVASFVSELCDERMLANAMAVTYNIDVERMPLGKISAGQLEDADKVLKEIQDGLVSGAANPLVLERLSSKFWTLVPQASKSTQRLPVIDGPAKVHELADMLDGLRNIRVASVASQGARSLFDVYRSLGVDLDPCDDDELELLRLMLVGTTSQSHGSRLELVDALKLSKLSQDLLDGANVFEGLADHRLLFHGSRKSNWIGILSEGLRIPRPDQVSNGSTLGLGCYFADCSSKSLQYCGIERGECGYMAVCEVALGRVHVVQSCCSEPLRAPYNTRLAKGMRTVDYVRAPGDGPWVPCGPVRPKSDTSYSTFLHNEVVIPLAHQYRFRFLLKIKRL
jgi:poly [ADP-ribose] polymerase 2/3/4